MVELGLSRSEPNYSKELTIFRTNSQWVMVVLFLIIMTFLPVLPFGSNYLLRLIVDFSITIIVVVGLNILTGLCGQGSIAQAAFMAVGAYLSVIFSTAFHLPFWLALPCASAIAGLFGAFFGLSALKVKGLYLFLVTLGAHFIIEYAIIHLPAFTGGQTGLPVPPPELFGFVFKSLRSYYYVVVFTLIITLIVAKNMVRTHIGRAWMAIRDNENVARAVGVDIFRYKLMAFFVGGAFAGIAGSLWAHSKSWLAPEDFSIMQACWFLGMAIVGGLGTIMGAIFGCVFLLGLGEVMTYLGPALGRVFPSVSIGVFAASAQIVYCVIILLFLVFEPGGLVSLWKRVSVWFESLTVRR